MTIMRRMKTVGVLASAALALTACGSDANPGAQSGGGSDVACEGKDTLAASGSSAQKNAMDRFVAAYEAACEGKTLNYNPSGSGAGITDFTGKQNDFAGSDSPLKAEKGEVEAAAKRCDGNDAWNLPLVFGPVAVSYNLEGVDSITLDAPTVAKVFSGKIKTWSDPAIAKLNEGAKLPNTPITVVFRSDESGTTDNFQKYLGTAAEKDWTKGDGKTFNGGIGEGAQGSDGVSSVVKSTPGAITYVEWSFAKQRELGVAKLVNSGGGEPVELTSESAGQAIEAAAIKGKGNDLVLDLDSIYATKAAGAYPLVLATYEIVCSKYSDPETGKAVKTFLSTAISDGQQGLEEDGYVPVPDAIKAKLTTAINAIS